LHSGVTKQAGNNLLKYKTIKSPVKGLYKDKGSKFIAIAFPVLSEEEFKKQLNSIRSEYHDARHHCYAFRIGTIEVLERYNDDGEPSGTAGKPILGQLHSFDITNVGIVVVRYFGGVKLGVGGLINAYKQATCDALGHAEIVEKEVMDYYKLFFDYSQMGDILSLLKKNKIEHFDIKMTDACEVTIILPYQDKSFLENLTRFNIKVKFIKTI